MAARVIEGWESSTAIADYAGKWSPTATVTISGATGRFGNGLRLVPNGAALSRALDAQPTWVLGFAVRMPALPASTIHTLCSFLDGAVVHTGLAVSPSSGTIFAWRGTSATSLGASSAALTAGVWAYVEVKATIHDTAGVVVVRVNGAEVLNLTSVDTRNAGNATANVVRLGPLPGGGASAIDFDDVYVFDTTGGANTDFAGDCRVERLVPSGAGATTAWTPSAGSNYACVDEAPPTGDTDYVSSSTAGQTDTYAFGNLATTSGTVHAVQASAIARKDDAGSRTLALVARPGGTDRLGATQGVGDTYSAYTQVWDVNPDTSAAWTIAAVNASEFGQRLVSEEGKEELMAARVTQEVVEVLVTPALRLARVTQLGVDLLLPNEAVTPAPTAVGRTQVVTAG